MALLASYAKDEPLLKLANLLKSHDWNLMGSAGTAAYLNRNNIHCRDVAEIVGEPILGHRVVTLSREIYAGLLAATDEDFSELAKMNIAPIDLVYVTLYPLEETIQNQSSTAHDVLEQTDIGGPTLLRAAAKGRRISLSSASQIDDLSEWIENGSPEAVREALVTRFAAAAERRVAEYVSTSASYWESKN